MFFFLTTLNISFVVLKPYWIYSIPYLFTLLTIAITSVGDSWEASLMKYSYIVQFASIQQCNRCRDTTVFESARRPYPGSLPSALDTVSHTDKRNITIHLHSILSVTLYLFDKQLLSVGQLLVQRTSLFTWTLFRVQMSLVHLMFSWN